jgi:putative membrane protein insertion efficiency factor
MKNIVFTIVICGLLVFYSISSCYSLSDDKSELEFILSNNPMQDVPKIKQKHARIGILTGAIRFYQLFLSTQDIPVCNFTPTCSQFGIDSLRQFGAIRGILLTSDRLQRCNGMSAPYYKIDYKSGKFIDPVQIYADLLSRRQKP